MKQKDKLSLRFSNERLIKTKLKSLLINHFKKTRVHFWTFSPVSVENKIRLSIQIFEQYSRMYHFKPKAVPPMMVPRELFWETRRNLSFKKQFALAKQNTALIKVKASIGQ